MLGWKPRVVTDLESSSAQSRETSLSSAQPWCNFVVFAPATLPSWLMEDRTVLRPECVPGRPKHLEATRTPWSTANSATVRTEYVTTDGTRFRVKQFLYDWARPAVDHPCLWGGAVRPYSLKDGHVAWLGVDYKKNQAASATIQRTSIELSVLEGNLIDEKIVEFYNALTIVDTEFALVLHREPMASLSYWARHRPGLIDVPFGLWHYHRQDPNEAYEWSSVANALSAEAPFYYLPESAGFEFDSLGIFHSIAGVELEIIYTSGLNKAREIRAILQRGDHGRVCAVREPHPACFEKCQIGSLSVQFGYVSPEYGPFDAVVIDSNSGIHALVMTSSAVGHTKDWFLDLLPKMRFA